MIDNGSGPYQVDGPAEKRVNPWIWLALVLGAVAGVVVLLYFGASAGPSGGCGGG